VFVDPQPRTYLVIAGGVQDLPPFTVYENPDAFPRAFVVPRAAPLPERRVQPTLKSTDFRETVLISGYDAGSEHEDPSGVFRPAAITEVQPNRVAVQVSAGSHGYLVLTDLWYPGWTCTVDGVPTPVLRGDFLFRAVKLPDGPHEVVFTFAPRSYRIGWWVSLLTLALVAAWNLASWVVSPRPAPREAKIA
jgi:hypothetical protein